MVVKTNETEVCTGVTNLIGLNIVLPSTQPNIPDCICPILFLNHDHHCYNFDYCYCDYFPIQATSLSLCLTNSTALQICFYNISELMLQNAHIHFFQSFIFPRCTGLHSVYRKYIKAIKIIRILGKWLIVTFAVFWEWIIIM